MQKGTVLRIGRQRVFYVVFILNAIAIALILTSCQCKHNYVGKITKESTYTTTGIKTYTCEKCGDSYTETIAKIICKHSYSKTIVQAPSVDAEGECKYVCSICGDSYSETIPRLKWGVSTWSKFSDGNLYYNYSDSSVSVEDNVVYGTFEGICEKANGTKSDCLFTIILTCQEYGNFQALIALKTTDNTPMRFAGVTDWMHGTINPLNRYYLKAVISGEEYEAPLIFSSDDTLAMAGDLDYEKYSQHLIRGIVKHTGIYKCEISVIQNFGDNGWSPYVTKDSAKYSFTIDTEGMTEAFESIYEPIYKTAIDLFNEGKYEEAKKMFLDPLYYGLGGWGYKDSWKYYEECLDIIHEDDFKAAVEQYDQGHYEEAIKLFRDLKLHGIRDEECNEYLVKLYEDDFKAAVEQYDQGHYKEAYNLLYRLVYQTGAHSDEWDRYYENCRIRIN